MNCPCCGGPLKRNEVAVSLDTNEIAVGWERDCIRLRPQEAEFAFVLCQARPRAVSFDNLITRIWGAREGIDPREHLRVLAYHTRKHIRPLGLTVRPVRGLGYRMDQVAA